MNNKRLTLSVNAVRCGRFILCCRGVFMKKTCVYCGRIHKKGYICPDKPKKFKNRTKKDKFRSTIAWQKKRNAVAERDLWLCRVCLEQGRLNGDSLQVHHITPLSEDYSLRLEDDNLITLCPVHHEQAECGKISAEHLRELAGSPPEGMNQKF